jgi:hypothetical protein
MYPAWFPAWFMGPLTASCARSETRLHGDAGKIYRIDKMKANFSRFWFTFRTWRTGAGSAD